MGKSRKFNLDDYEDDYSVPESRERDWRDERKEKRAKKEAMDIVTPFKPIWEQPRPQRGRR